MKHSIHFVNGWKIQLYSIKELHDKMSKDSDGYIYSLKTFREKLKLRYKEHVYFVEGTGRHCELVCFRDMANYILRNMKNDVDTKQNIKPQLLNSLKLISEKWRLAKPITLRVKIFAYQNYFKKKKLATDRTSASTISMCISP